MHKLNACKVCHKFSEITILSNECIIKLETMYFLGVALPDKIQIDFIRH